MNAALKEILGNVPGAAAVVNAVRPGRPKTRYNLEQLAAHLPGSIEEARPFIAKAAPGSRLLLFATLHYWIEQAAIMGLTLRGLGHEVTLAYLPYSSWEKPINTLDLRRQDLYTREVLRPLEDLLRVVPILESGGEAELPEVLRRQAAEQSDYDAMYSLQNEEVDRSSRLHRLRTERNLAACASALRLLRRDSPQAILIPNGLVTELGMFYRTARHVGIPTVTYEFNDQREQIWIARDDIVMHQNTDEIWRARGANSLTDVQRERIAAFEHARSSGRVYGKGTRQWQDVAAEGGEHVRQVLHLDSRPVVLLPTNVLGDSLTLGRHLFAGSMAEWIEATVRYFADRPNVQLVVRIHPGERLIRGTSMLEVVQRVLPSSASHIHLVGPSEKINTYDILDIASLGLTYTTTVGMEMAMRGVPVIVAGNTHYRNRGFSMDPTSWDEYFAMLDRSLEAIPGRRLNADQVELAWNYAYRFFFEYPFDFPWRLMHFWKDMDVWSVGRVLSEEGQGTFGRTFRHLAGAPIAW